MALYQLGLNESMTGFIAPPSTTCSTIIMIELYHS